MRGVAGDRFTGGVRIEQVAEGTHVLVGDAVNWAVLVEGDAVTLVDAGYPRDAEAVVASLAALGHRPEDVVAVLVTHAHVDHVGGLPPLVDRVGMPVLSGYGELAHLHGAVREQATPARVASRAWRPRVARWAAHAARLGATTHVTVPSALGVPDGVALDLPGHPVPLTVPGHTSGHTAWHLPSVDTLFVQRKISGTALLAARLKARVDVRAMVAARVAGTGD